MRFLLYIGNVLLILHFYSLTVSSSEHISNSFALFTTQNTLANEPINFHYVNIGQMKTKNISIENSGTSSYLIEKVTLQEGGLGVFSLFTNPTVPVQISPNQLINITLNFLPNKINSFYDTILIYFEEPFRFIYSIPIEGHSICFNQLFFLDTFGIVGTPNFRIPIFVKGDPNLVEPITVNLSFTVTVSAKVFFIDSVGENFTLTQVDVNQTYLSYKMNISNLTFDSTTKLITYLYGRLFLSEQDTTNLTISEIECETEGVNFEVTNGILKTLGICNTNLSIVDFIPNYVHVAIPNQIVNDEISIEFSPIKQSPREIADIRIYNTIGKMLSQVSSEINSKINIPLAIPSGVYKLVIHLPNQTFSEIICVVK
ncbi:MAG: hypothetical protein ACK42Z_06515 [Candidatus Kapaibacteriota bacterium]